MAKINKDRIVDSYLLEELEFQSDDLEHKYLIDILQIKGRGDELIANSWKKYWRSVGTPYCVVTQRFRDSTHLIVYKLRHATDCHCDVDELLEWRICNCPEFIPFLSN